MGLAVPYDDPDRRVADAVHDALINSGMPVVIWRRDQGDPHELLKVLLGSSSPPVSLNCPKRCTAAGTLAGAMIPPM